MKDKLSTVGYTGNVRVCSRKDVKKYMGLQGTRLEDPISVSEEEENEYQEQGRTRRKKEEEEAEKEEKITTGKSKENIRILISRITACSVSNSSTS